MFLLRRIFLAPSMKNITSIFPDRFFIQHFTISCKLPFPNLHDTKTSVSLKQTKILQKEKCHSSLVQKAIKISRNYFSCYRPFKTSSTLPQKSCFQMSNTFSFFLNFIRLSYHKITNMPKKQTNNNRIMYM